MNNWFIGGSKFWWWLRILYSFKLVNEPQVIRSIQNNEYDQVSHSNSDMNVYQDIQYFLNISMQRRKN